jgi:hypothetical protein
MLYGGTFVPQNFEMVVLQESHQARVLVVTEIHKISTMRTHLLPLFGCEL